jgi:dihydrofolate reductase
MTLVTAQMSVSLDGYYAGPKQADDDASDLQSWMTGPEAAGFFRVTRWAIDAEAWRQRLGFSGGARNVNSDIIGETYDSVGAYVMGRRMADGGEIPWGAEPPFRAPVFVVTHRPRPTVRRQGGTSFTYVTDGIHSAIERAREAATNKNVAIAGGGTLLRRVIALGLLDELELHIAPVLLGDGMRLFDHRLELDTFEGIELTPDRVTATDDVTHIRYRVRERRPLVLDNRGRDEQARVA